MLSAPPEVRLPSVGVAEVEVGRQARAAGALPITVSARVEAGVAPGRVRVEALDHGVAAQLGARFLAFRVDRADRVAAKGRVEVEVDYSGFRHAYGADFDTRLQLVRFPACVLERPEDPECSSPAILGARNDVGRGVLIAELDAGPDPVAVGASERAAAVDSAETGVFADPVVEVSGESVSGAEAELSKSADGGFVYALMSGVSGTAGSFAATPLAPSGKWQVGLSSGDFSWEYPIPVPSASVGAAPSLSLAYSSQSVDGMTAASNTQPGVVGLGWDLAGLGFIERRYRSCADDGGSGGDLCWHSHNATISLNGVSTELVRDDATGIWRLKDDPAWRVELKTGAQNGDNDGEHWVVTTPDGVQYWFGYGEERWGSSVWTNSAFTVPVYGNHAGEPCSGGPGWC